MNSINTERPEIEINSCFRRALELMEKSHKTLFITGKAGTGKSTLLEHFRSITGKNVAVLAPTGVAALNVKGQTIHSFFRFPPHITKDDIRKKSPTKKLAELLLHLDAIIIDEVSMVRADLLDCVDEALKFYLKNSEPFGGVQMIFIGDLYQLPPVVSGDDEKAMFRNFYQSPYFFDAKALDEVELELVELEKIYRQTDPDFIELLNKIRNSVVQDSDMQKLNSRHLSNAHEFENSDDFRITLTTTNSAADTINATKLAQLKTASKRYQGDIEGDFDNKHLPTSLGLELKIGSQIMLLNNDPTGRWANGSIGKIVDIKLDIEGWEENLVVELQSGKIVEVTRNTWKIFKYIYNHEQGKLDADIIGSFTQYPVRLAWAVTIHKSQGKTFDNVAVDIGSGAFAQGQVYVAISRCTSFEGLVLKRPIQKRHIWLDAPVTRFAKRFQSSNI